MSQTFLTQGSLMDSEGVRFCKAIAWTQAAVTNAGIGYTPGGFLTPGSLMDSEGVRFCKLIAWLSVLADGVNPNGRAQSGVDSQTVTLAQLAAIPMVGVALPVLKVWFKTADNTQQIWQARLSSAATSATVQRANDYAQSGVAWIKGG